MSERIKTYGEFWPFYLNEHRSPINRVLHFIGTAGTLVILTLAIVLSSPILLIGVPLFGYGFAWAGHFVFEKNRPATFKYPLWSLISDYRMFFELLIGRLRFNEKKT